MKKFSKSVVVALVTAALIVGIVVAATQTIGGTATTAYLRVAVLDNGAMTVEQYTGSAWQHNMYPDATGDSKGTALCINGTRYDMGGNVTFDSNGIPNPAAPGTNTGGVVGTGTITSTWTAGGIAVTQTTSYIDGDQHYTIQWALENTSGGTLTDLRFFHGEDTLLAGSDSGNGWWNPALGNFGSIGVTHPTTGQQMWLEADSEAPFEYESRHYDTVRTNVDACALDGTVDPTVHDNGYALEFRNATLADGSIWAITLEEHFTLAATPAPTLTSLSPDHGPEAGGTVVTINGTNLTGGSFTFGGSSASCSVNPGGTVATCTTPAHTAGLVDVDVNTSSGSDTLTNAYTFDPATPTPTSSSALPATGFAPGIVTVLPAQPAEKAYADTDLMLNIPTLGVKMDIVGVPLSGGSWDASWLGTSAGWLEGSAFPTWAGNTILTGHVYDANNHPGPFANLKTLRYGDTIEIKAWGETYTYQVVESKLVFPNSVSRVFEHEDMDYLTLLTCEYYNPISGDYFMRRMVKAVLVSVQ